jgi:hypothetical protein
MAESELQKAMDSKDMSQIARGIYELNELGVGDSEVKRQAVDALSEHYKHKFMDSPDQTLDNLANFDANCVRLIGQNCSEPARIEVSRHEAARHERVAAEKAEKAAIAAEEAETARRDMLREIRRGDRKVTTLDEALVAYRPASGDGLAIRPAISGGDGEYYILQAYITSKRGDSYIYWWADSPLAARGGYGMPAMGAAFESPAFIEDGVGFNSHVNVVGRYVNNRTLDLVHGAQAVVPVFDNAHIFRWSRH